MQTPSVLMRRLDVPILAGSEKPGHRSEAWARLLIDKAEQRCGRTDLLDRGPTGS